jgi:hypothetical protein
VNSHPIIPALSCAVPLWIMRLEELSHAERSATIKRWAGNAAEVLERTGEAILYRTQPGESAEAFNAVAKAIAALSFAPGGVTLFGEHWETQPATPEWQTGIPEEKK